MFYHRLYDRFKTIRLAKIFRSWKSESELSAQIGSRNGRIFRNRRRVKSRVFQKGEKKGFPDRKRGKSESEETTDPTKRIDFEIRGLLLLN